MDHNVFNEIWICNKTFPKYFFLLITERSHWDENQRDFWNAFCIELYECFFTKAHKLKDN